MSGSVNNFIFIASNLTKIPIHKVKGIFMQEATILSAFHQSRSACTGVVVGKAMGGTAG